jgi:dephospho-CoA kinase
VAARAIQVLAFVGAPAAGKTEAASVAKTLGIPIITMGDVVRAELRRRGLPLSDENAGRIASELRAREGMDAIAKRCIPHIRAIAGKKAVIVIDGIRGISEVETFKNEFGTDFTLVSVDAPLNLRYERIKTRGRGDDALSIDEFEAREERENEWGLEEAMKNADKVITNTGSRELFKKQLEEILAASRQGYGNCSNSCGF